MVADAGGWFHRSTDGLTWSVSGSPVGPAPRSLAYGNGVWVALGESGATWWSTNASNWNYRVVGSNTLNGVSFVNGRFVAGGIFGQIFTSTDGTNWLACSRAVARLPLYRVACLDDQFFAVGDRGLILRSPDAVNWQRCAVSGTPTLRAVTRGGGLCLAGGDSSLLASTDGSNWGRRARACPSRAWPGAMGRFVAAGPQNTVLSSTDGTNWIGASPVLAGDWQDAVFANGLFLLGGTGGKIAVSATGTQWVVPEPALHRPDHAGHVCQWPLRGRRIA